MECLNEVQLAGELLGPPELHTINAVARLEWRLSVPRCEAGSDSINCYTTDPKMIARVSAIKPGRKLQCTGAVRSRFWRSGGRTAATQEVEVLRLRLR